MLSRIQLSTRCLRISRTTTSTRTYASSSSNRNEPIVEMLRKHRDLEEQSPNTNGYKVRAFDNAIKALSQLDYSICLPGEARVVAGIGPGISKRIDDFLAEYKSPYKITKEELQQSTLRRAKADLETVLGLGVTKARTLIDAGCLGISDLKKPRFWKMLTPTQRIGATHYHHLKQPVTREQAETIAQFIRDNISSKYEVIITGDYRRGSETLTGIELVVLHPHHVYVPLPETTPGSPPQLRLHKIIKKAAFVNKDLRAASPLFSDLVPILQERGLVAAHLSSGIRRWQGVVRVPEKTEKGEWCHREKRLTAIEELTGEYKLLDINLVPIKSKGAGLVAFTGDIQLNKDLRLRASKMGMLLNEFGLWRWTANNRLSDSTESSSDDVAPSDGYWQLIKASTEQDIFEQLGMEYIEPHRRNFGYVQGPSAKVK